MGPEHTLNHFFKEILVNGFTMRSYGFLEGLLISLYRRASFRRSIDQLGQGTPQSVLGELITWRTFPHRKLIRSSTNSSSARFNPSQHILTASLIANLNSNVKTSLLSIPLSLQRFVAAVAAFGREPTEKVLAADTPVFPFPWELLLPLRFPVSLESLLPRPHSSRPLLNGLQEQRALDRPASLKHHPLHPPVAWFCLFISLNQYPK